MLTDPEEIRIISKARQKNVQDPNRSRAHFDNIFKDFLGKIKFDGKVLLDLGPGQYDFGEIARARGALVHGIDNDPAVIELGRYKSFPVISDRLQDIKAVNFDTPFDGVFCKLSINAFWFHDDALNHEGHIDEIVKLIKPGGWAWIAPWNGVPKQAELSEAAVAQVLHIQSKAFKGRRFTSGKMKER